MRTGHGLVASAILLAACNAFPGDLRARKFPGSDAGGDAGDVPRVSCNDAACPNATLIIADSGPHRALDAFADTVHWSTQRGGAYDVKSCSWNDCSAPALLESHPCASDTALSGFLSVVGSNLYISNGECRGWLCWVDLLRPGAPQCAFGGPVYRLLRGPQGILATNGDLSTTPAVEKTLARITINANQTAAAGSVTFGALAGSATSPIATNADRVAWLESTGPSTFRVRGCTGDVSCGEPTELLPERSGIPTAIAGAADAFILAYQDGGSTQLVRIAAGGGAEPFATVSGLVGAIAAANDVVYFSEGGTIERCPLGGTCAPEPLGLVPAPVELIAVSPGRERLYVLGMQGLYFLPL